MKKKFKKRHAFFAGVLVVSVTLAADFALKQVANQWKKREPVVPANISEGTGISHRTFSEKYHHGFVPQAQGTEQFGPFEVDYFVNSLGMRDSWNRVVLPRESGSGRILLLGDSFVEGVGMNYEDTIGGQLSKKLSDQGIEVLNGGVASYCPTLMEARLRDWIETADLRFDLAVIFIDISDVRDEFRYQKDARGVFVDADSGEFDTAIREAETKERPIAVWLESRVEKNFVLLGALTRNARLLWRSDKNPMSSVPFAYNNWPAYRGALEPWIQKALQRQTAAMDKILSLCRDRNADCLLVVYPGLEQVEAGHEADRHNQYWQEWAQSNQVAFLNLYPDFLGLKDRYPDYILSSNDSHWNKQGAELVAQVLLERGDLEERVRIKHRQASKAQPGK